MRGSEHYRKAEEIEERAVTQIAGVEGRRSLNYAEMGAVANNFARAQVHATLALAAATALVHIDQYPTEDELAERIADAVGAADTTVGVHLDFPLRRQVHTVARVAARAALNPDSTED